MPPSLTLPCLIGCLAAILLAALVGSALRSMRVRHAWILSGVLAGMALGPQGLGRVSPQLQASLFRGAAAEQRDADLTQRTLEVARSTARSQAASIDDADASRLQADALAARERLLAAREAFDFPAMWMVSLLATFVMIGASPLLGRVEWWRDGGPAIGVWTAAAPAAGLLVAMTLHAPGAAEPWWICAAAIACVGAAPARARDRWVGVQLAGPMAAGADGAGAVAGLLSLTLVLVAAWTGVCSELAWLMPWGGLMAAWGLASTPPRAVRRLSRVALAGTVAIACSRLDFPAEWNGWLALWTLVAIDDLKWLGATIGLVLWGRLGWARSLRVCLPLADASPAIAAMASVALLAGAVPAWMAASLLLAAAAASLMEPLRRGTALQLERAAHGA